MTAGVVACALTAASSFCLAIKVACLAATTIGLPQILTWNAWKIVEDSVASAIKRSIRDLSTSFSAFSVCTSMVSEAIVGAGFGSSAQQSESVASARMVSFIDEVPMEATEPPLQSYSLEPHPPSPALR